MISKKWYMICTVDATLEVYVVDVTETAVVYKSRGRHIALPKKDIVDYMEI